MAEIIDLHHLGRPGLIGAWRVDDVLVDCGPMSCLPALLEAIGDWRPRALLLTHIHFDHAGAAGALASRWPDLKIWVHELGAKHLLDPSRLVASARRVFGADLDRLFGVMAPVPEKNLHVVQGGERVGAFEAIYTPGHASHHIAFIHDDGCAFVGDVAAVRLARDIIMPPTPPPDINLTLWNQSLDRVAERSPTSLALPHYGVVEDPPPYIAMVRQSLLAHEELARTSTRDEYIVTVTDTLNAALPPALAEDYRAVVPPAQNFVGLHRWIDQS